MYKHTIYIKYTEYTKLKNIKLQNIKTYNLGNKLQNMNYENYIYNREKKRIQQFECILACLVYFVQSIVILNIGFGVCVFDCIWEHGLNFFFEENISKRFPEV